MPSPSPVVTCSGLSFAWPDGTDVFTGLSLVISPGRTGLVGVNGSGKSTLLRLIAGELKPTAGSVSVAGELGFLPQNLALGAPGATVEEALGIAGIRAAVAAIEAGDASEENFARVGSDWDVEERARAWLDRLGLNHLGLDDRVERLSGGETILVALAGAVQEIALLGGGTVESYPEDTAGRKVSGWFLYSGTVALFERHGFERKRRIGKHHWVVSRFVG